MSDVIFIKKWMLKYWYSVRKNQWKMILDIWTPLIWILFCFLNLYLSIQDVYEKLFLEDMHHRNVKKIFDVCFPGVPVGVSESWWALVRSLVHLYQNVPTIVSTLPTTGNPYQDVPQHVPTSPDNLPAGALVRSLVHINGVYQRTHQRSYQRSPTTIEYKTNIKLNKMK